MPAGFFIGVPGTMLSLPDAQGALSMSDGPDVNLTTLLGGGRFASVAAGSRRAWKVDIPAMSPTEISNLSILLRAMPAPYAWLSVWATRVNVLTPDMSLFKTTYAGLTKGAIVECEGGIFTPSASSATGALAFLGAGIPVFPGMPVTGSFFARQSGASPVSVYVRFKDAAGVTFNSNAGSLAVIGTGPMQRITRSTIAPAGAVTAELLVQNASLVAAPALTYTATANEWGVGDGCLSSVVSGFEVTPTEIETDSPGDRLADVSFTVMEVG